MDHSLLDLILLIALFVLVHFVSHIFKIADSLVYHLLPLTCHFKMAHREINVFIPIGDFQIGKSLPLKPQSR